MFNKIFTFLQYCLEKNFTNEVFEFTKITINILIESLINQSKNLFSHGFYLLPGSAWSPGQTRWEVRGLMASPRW